MTHALLVRECYRSKAVRMRMITQLPQFARHKLNGRAPGSQENLRLWVTTDCNSFLRNCCSRPFKKLRAHEAHLASFRAKIASVGSLGFNFSRSASYHVQAPKRLPGPHRLLILVQGHIEHRRRLLRQRRLPL